MNAETGESGSGGAAANGYRTDSSELGAGYSESGEGCRVGPSHLRSRLALRLTLRGSGRAVPPVDAPEERVDCPQGVNRHPSVAAAKPASVNGCDEHHGNDATWQSAPSRLRRTGTKIVKEGLGRPVV